MQCRGLSEFRVIHKFMALKASRDLKQWTDKGFLAEVDMRKGVLLPIHIEVALLDGDCCWPRSASCLIIWVGSHTHLCSKRTKDLQNEQLNQEGVTSWNHGDWESMRTSCSECNLHTQVLLKKRTIYLTFWPGNPSWPQNFAHPHFESCWETA